MKRNLRMSTDFHKKNNENNDLNGGSLMQRFRNNSPNSSLFVMSPKVIPTSKIEATRNFLSRSMINNDLKHYKEAKQYP